MSTLRFVQTAEDLQDAEVLSVQQKLNLREEVSCTQMALANAIMDVTGAACLIGNVEAFRKGLIVRWKSLTN